ncbi:MAG: hypothetical protein KDG54_14535 [Geminicoccaceae bacterium]|nr:hypothetical protein [Geminicoccaceae bacterium]
MAVLLSCEECRLAGRGRKPTSPVAAEPVEAQPFTGQIRPAEDAAGVAPASAGKVRNGVAIRDRRNKAGDVSAYRVSMSALHCRHAVSGFPWLEPDTLYPSLT